VQTFFRFRGAPGAAHAAGPPFYPLHGKELHTAHWLAAYLLPARRLRPGYCTAAGQGRLKRHQAGATAAGTGPGPAATVTGTRLGCQRWTAGICPNPWRRRRVRLHRRRPDRPDKPTVSVAERRFVQSLHKFVICLHKVCTSLTYVYTW
jgi:hypothetical protein